jgi:hypothetical protein
LHERLLNWLGDQATIDWSRASLDSVSVRAKKGANAPVPVLSTVAKLAPNITSSWTGTAFPLPSDFRRPTPTTQLNYSHS